MAYCQNSTTKHLKKHSDADNFVYKCWKKIVGFLSIDY